MVASISVHLQIIDGFDKKLSSVEICYHNLLKPGAVVVGKISWLAAGCHDSIACDQTHLTKSEGGIDLTHNCSRATIFSSLIGET
jgi:hypothetical protein